MLQVDDSVIADIGKGFSVPAQPDLLLKIQQLMSDDDLDINVIAETISQDVAVSSKILKTVNSPIYGLSRTISDIQKAACYIGINGITSLVTNTLIKNTFAQSDCSIVLEDFWGNASNIANMCVFVGKQTKQKLSQDKLFSLGLFHDCGIPVMAMKYKDYPEIYEHAYKTPSETLTSIEESIYHVNHATLGYYVATSWRLPKDICELILCHHDRSYLEIINNNISQYYFAVLKMSENIVHNYTHFRDASDWAYVKDSVFTLLNFDEEIYQDIFEDSAEILD